MLSLDRKNALLVPCLAVVGALVLASAGFAAPDATIHEEREEIVKIMLGDDPSALEMIHLDVTDLEIGESHVAQTESGKTVEVVRTESGFETWIDGERLDIPEIREKKIVIERTNDDGDHEHRIETFVIGGDGTEKHVFAHGGEGQHRMIFVSEDGSTTRLEGEGSAYAWSTGGEGLVRLRENSAADHLLESGVLDELDDDTRERILETLREHREANRTIRVITKVDEDS